MLNVASGSQKLTKLRFRCDMKQTSLALVFALILLVAAGCGATDHGCATNSECRDNRVCLAHSCVASQPADAGSGRDIDSEGGRSDARLADASPDTDASDADKGPPDSSSSGCTANCIGSCADGVCHIDGDAHDVPIQCPDGFDCVVDCSRGGDCPSSITCGDGACTVICGGSGGGTNCQGVIDCADSTSCEVQCLGGGACASDIYCGSSDCTVECSGGGACAGKIECGSSSCNLTCSSTSNCREGYDCQAAEQCKCSGYGCQNG